MRQIVDNFESVSCEERMSLTALCMEYAWRVDHGFASSVWELFTPDGICELPWGTLSGQDNLRAGWAERGHRPIRTRHLISNLRFARLDAATISGSIAVTAYMAEKGSSLVAAPYVVGDYVDVYHCANGRSWRIYHRRFQVAFSNTASLPAPPIF